MTGTRFGHLFCPTLQRPSISAGNVYGIVGSGKRASFELFQVPRSASDQGGGSASWSTIEGALSRERWEGTAYAVCGPLNNGQSTNTLRLTNFGFQIPSGLSILAVYFRAYVSPGSTFATWHGRLVSGGSPIGTEQSNIGAGGSGFTLIQDFGLGTWGATLTPAIVNASDFGIDVRADFTGTATAYVAYFELRVITDAGLEYATRQPMMVRLLEGELSFVNTVFGEAGDEKIEVNLVYTSNWTRASQSDWLSNPEARYITDAIADSDIGIYRTFTERYYMAPTITDTVYSNLTSPEVIKRFYVNTRYTSTLDLMGVTRRVGDTAYAQNSGGLVGLHFPTAVSKNFNLMLACEVTPVGY